MQGHLSSSKVVVKSAFYNLLGFGVSILYMVFLIPIVVGYLGVEQYGLWSIILALTGYVGLVDLGLGTSFVPFIARFASLESYEEVNKIVQHGLLFYACLSAVILVAGVALAPLLFSLVRVPTEHLKQAHTIFLVSLVGLGVSSLAGVFGSVLSALQRMDIYTVLLSAFLIEKFVAIVAAVSLGVGLLGLVLADLIVTVLSMIPLIVLTRRSFPQLRLHWIGYDHSIMKKLLKFGTQLQVSRIAEAVQLHFDKLILSRFIGLSAVSMYDFGSRLGGRLRALPVNALSSLLPAVSALDAADNKPRIVAALTRSTRYLAITAVPMFAFSMCFADDIIYIWLGEGFGQAAMTLRILSFAHTVSAVASATAIVSQGMVEPGIQMRTTLIQATLNVILSLALVIKFGFYGAVVGTTVSMMIGSVLLFQWYGKRLMESPLTTLIQVMSRPTICVIPSVVIGSIAVGVCQPLLQLHSRTERGSLLLAVALVFFFLYCFIVIRSKTVTTDDREFLDGVLPERFKYLMKFF